MLVRLDHLVHSVADHSGNSGHPGASAQAPRAGLSGAIDGGARLGLDFKPGGRHPNFNTANALLYSGLTYWELLALEGVPPETAPAFVRLSHRLFHKEGAGITSFGLGSDDLEGDVDALRRAGFNLSNPALGTRSLPDGRQLRWRTAEFEGWPEEAGIPPFLIQHEGREAERAALLEGLGFSGAGGPSKMEELAWPVADPGAATELYRRVLGATGNGVAGTTAGSGLAEPGGIGKKAGSGGAVGVGSLRIAFAPAGKGENTPAGVRWSGAGAGELLGVRLNGPHY